MLLLLLLLVGLRQVAVKILGPRLLSGAASPNKRIAHKQQHADDTDYLLRSIYIEMPSVTMLSLCHNNDVVHCDSAMVMAAMPAPTSMFY